MSDDTAPVVDPVPAPAPAPAPLPTYEDVRVFEDASPHGDPGPVPNVLEIPTPFAPSIAGPLIADSPADAVTCLVCGRSFDPGIPTARCESRTEMCSACCPHEFCNDRSIFAPAE